MPVLLCLLALAVFSMSTSEFMLAGLVPEVAASLDVPVAAAGALTSAFAVGMVLGAPSMALLARSLPRRPSLVAFLAVFALAHAAGALTTSFAVLLATRVVSALADAGFLALAVTVVASLAPPDRLGRAMGVLLGGTTLACVVGVPAGAVVGDLAGWRATFWVVAGLCALATVGVLAGLPAGEGHRPGVGARAELAVLRRPRLLVLLVLGLLVNAATFGSYAFLAPITTRLAGLPTGAVGLVLAAFGVGSFVGVTVGGRLADARATLVVGVGGPLLLAGWTALALGAGRGRLLVPLALVLGALSFGVGSTLVTRILHAAGDAPTLCGAFATVALNLGAVLGPLLAGAALAADPAGPARVSAALVALALLLALAPPTRRAWLPEPR